MYTVKSPFSDAFKEIWDMWVTWRWETHSFRYANPISEQAALNELVDVSEGDEDHAKRIVNRSISRGWKGFYKIHNPKKDEKNGESPKKKAAGRATPDDLYAAYIKPTGTEGR
jgi:hypothetical protein